MNYFFGFSYWKHSLVEPFFEDKPCFVNPLFGKGHLEKALRKGMNGGSSVYIWGRKAFPEVEAYARDHGLPLYRVEDGFIRSVGLGSDLTRPYSLVVDSRGIYFDPACESDLEHLLQRYDFASEPELPERAAAVRRHLSEKKLSKYNVYGERDLELPKERTVLLVPGQVEDDASIRFGAPGMTNLELLQRARRSRPEAYIVYKPHPDVLSGNRAGAVPEEEALRYADRVVTDVGLDSVLVRADEVHTMTSLVGFEALMRGKRVTTYGLPFYAGWGLTTDMRRCERRTRRLQLDELVAGALLLYPRYIDPETKAPCGIEAVLEGIERERSRMAHSPVRRFLARQRNRAVRKGQVLLRFLKEVMP